MKCLMKSWLHPSNRSASVALPCGASKTYCFSTFTQGRARRSAANRSRDRVSSFSFAMSALRAPSHSSRETMGLFIVLSSNTPWRIDTQLPFALHGRTGRLAIDRPPFRALPDNRRAEGARLEAVAVPIRNTPSRTDVTRVAR
jgi:hypothetical protein